MNSQEIWRRISNLIFFSIFLQIFMTDALIYEYLKGNIQNFLYVQGIKWLNVKAKRMFSISRDTLMGW